MDAIRSVAAVELTTVAAGQDAGLGGMARNSLSAEATEATDDDDVLAAGGALDGGVVPPIPKGRGAAGPGESPKCPGDAQSYQKDAGWPEYEQGYVNPNPPIGNG